MKRVISLLLCAALLLGCAGCDTGTVTKETGEHYFDLSALTDAERGEAAERDTQYLAHFGGYVGERVEGNLKNWLYNAYESNPLMLDAIRQKGQTDIADQAQFWFGMFAPSLLRSAAGCYDLEKDQRLYETIERQVADSLACIDAYGSLEYDAEGTEFPLINPSWINGAMAWYEASKSEAALELAVKLGEYYIEKAESRGINDSMPIGGIAKLYLATGDTRFYELLEKYLLAWRWTGGDYHNAAQSGTEYCDRPRSNWENVFEVAALGAIGEVLGDESYNDSLRFMFESIVLTDRRSTGANTTTESAAGSPYQNGSAETCGNVAWTFMMAEAARRLKQSDIIDEIELTFWNADLGAQDVAGRWWTYDTPQEGYRLASIKNLNWQSIQGAPEFSCCMSNASLGIGTLSGWATLRDDSGIYVNYYGESEFVTAAPSGGLVRLTQETAYPANGNIRLTLELEESEEFTLHLRVPVWSENSAVKVNGKQLEAPNPGSYYSVTKTWQSGDTVELTLDMSPHYWAAEEMHAGEVSVYYGPLLLALDQRFNAAWDGTRKWVDLTDFTLTPVEYTGYPQPLVTLKAVDAEGTERILCDFATAGQSGTYYTTWFKNDQLAPQKLTRNVCSWNQRLN